ncbi:hypothetical protein NIES4073_13580 [Kalymmatonema gypsitolerans NIES-4073]|nr:hypothetical protein NIES4073_13580 [Scytonema sp. NIES-4073]
MNIKIRLLSAFTLSVSAFAAIPNQENRQSIYQSIQRYLESFISPVKQKKVAILRRANVLDQANSAVVLYQPVRLNFFERVFQNSILNSKKYFHFYF